ncbi:MAG: thioesterase family protein [Chitinophagaceae bacterium]
MFTASTQIRIHYALTDQMGLVYHGHYAQFFEIGRTEAIRQLGFTYKEIEAMGIIMPVVDLHTKFLRPVKYDELITVKISLLELPVHHKVVFHAEVFNQAGQLCTTGDVTLYFIEAASMKRCAMPDPLKEKLFPYFVTEE